MIPPHLIRPSGRRAAIAVVLLLLVVGVVVAALRLRAGRHEAPRYRTLPVAIRSIVQAVEAPAQIDVASRTDVGASAPGRLVEILAKPGDTVSKGQALARLDPRRARVDVASAAATEGVAAGKVAEAEAAYEAAQETTRRTQKLVEMELSHPRHLTAARSAEARALGALRAARAEQSLAKNKRAAANLGQQELTLRAPVEGTVLSAPRRSGAMVSPETGPLFVLGSTLDEVIVQAFVAETDIGFIGVGQPASFTVPAFADRSFKASVSGVLIEPEVRQGVVSYPVMLTASNPERLLLPKMTATVRIEVARATDVLAVREAALRFSPEGASPASPRSRVWVSRDGVHLEAMAVSPGVSDGENTEVKAGGSGLRASDPVVVGLLPRSEGQNGGPGITLGGRR